MTLGEFMRRWQERRTLRIMRAEHRAQMGHSSLVDVRQLHLETQVRDANRNLQNVRAQLEQEIRERDRDIRALQQAYTDMEREMQHRLDAKEDTITSLRAALDNEGSSECELPENVLIGRDIIASVVKEINARSAELKSELSDCRKKVNIIHSYMDRAIEEDEEQRKAMEAYRQQRVGAFLNEAESLPCEPPEASEPESEAGRLQEDLRKAKQQLEETANHARQEVEKCRENFKLREMMHKMRLTDMGKKLLEMDGRLKHVQSERDFFESQLRQAKGWSVSPEASFTRGNQESEKKTEGARAPGKMMVNPMFACEAIKENVEAHANGAQSASDTPILGRRPEQLDPKEVGERLVKSDQTPSLSQIFPAKSAESSTSVSAKKAASKGSTIDMEDDFWRFDSQELETPFNATQYPAEVEKIMAKEYETATKASSKKGSNEISDKDLIQS